MKTGRLRQSCPHSHGVSDPVGSNLIYPNSESRFFSKFKFIIEPYIRNSNFLSTNVSSASSKLQLQKKIFFSVLPLFFSFFPKDRIYADGPA